jgi:quercetin dioxygenase-like cupin family protein
MQYFYSTDEMDKNMPGEGYSPAKGSWVTGEKIIFGLITIPAGTKSEPHNHPNEQFSIIMSGQIQSKIEGESQTLSKGNIIYRPANAIHSAEVIGDEDYVFVTAKDTAWGIQGTPSDTATGGVQPKEGQIPYYYDTSKMDNKPAGEGYSPANGSWVTGEKIIFGDITIPAGTKADPHSHPNEQMIFVISGAGEMLIEGESNRLKAGDIIHVPANAVHSAVIDSGEDYKFITAKDTSWGIVGTPAKTK